MSHAILLFDIDRTLFNTSKFADAIDAKILSKMDLNKKNQFKEITKNYLNKLNSPTDFSPESYCFYLAQNLSIPSQVLEQVFEDDSLYVECLYSEVINTLNELHKRYSLGIFSEGFRDFQMKKLVKSGIINFFEKKYIFIFRRKVVSVSELPIEHVSIIDDKLQVLQEIKMVNTIWINRKDNAVSEQFTTVHSLSELLNVKFL